MAKTVTKKPVKAKPESSLVVIRTEEQASKALRALELKKEIEGFASNCDKLVIKTTDDEAIAVNLFTQLNTVVKKVKEQGKKLRDPNTEANRLIKKVEDEIVGTAEDVVKAGQKKVIAFRQEQAEKERKELEAQALLAKQKEQELHAEVGNALDQFNSIYKYEIEIINKFHGCKNINELKEQFDAYAHSENWVAKDGGAWPDYEKEGEEMRVRLVDFKNHKKEYFTEVVRPGADKNIIMSNMSAAYTNAMQLAAKHNMLLVESQNEEAQEQQEEIQAEQQGIAFQASTPVRKPGDRFTWTFEVEDLSETPLEWLQLNAHVAKEYMDAHRDEFEDGKTYVVNGVKFYQKQSVRF